MNSFSKKEYLSLKMPTEEVAVSDQKRILLALEALGYPHVTMPLRVIRKLYPLCRCGRSCAGRVYQPLRNACGARCHRQGKDLRWPDLLYHHWQQKAGWHLRQRYHRFAGTNAAKRLDQHGRSLESRCL
ncbi:MAG: hypothetical protein IJF02_05230 [Oscillospiraceae bacterium]|nr:hypothetical protein [Oscillospiraceae bacterium]